MYVAQKMVMNTLPAITVNCKMLIITVSLQVSPASKKLRTCDIFFTYTEESSLFLWIVKKFTDCWQPWF